jgi:hypothetical protein
MSRPAHSVTIRSAVSIYNWLVERTDPEPTPAGGTIVDGTYVMTKAIMCRECGLIEIVGDVNKLRRLTTGAA